MNLQHLFDIPTEKAELQRMLDDFCDLTGFAAVVSDSEGTMLTKLSNPSEFCTLMRAQNDLCTRSDKIAGKIAARSGEVCIYKCHAGLVDFTIPIFIDGKHLGNILAGQVRTSLTMQIDLSKTHFNTRTLLTDEQKKLISKVAIMNQDKLKKSSKILEIIRKYIVERIKTLQFDQGGTVRNPQIDTYESYKHKVNLIIECIMNVKYDVGKKLLIELVETYIINSQTQLSTKLYWDIYNHAIRNLNIELVDKKKFQSSFIGETEIGRIYYDLYDKAFDTLLKNKSFKTKDQMNYAIAYMQRYSYTKIKNTTVADYMNISVDYFAKLFKEHFDISIVDYNKRYKLQQAKKLLSHTDLSIQSIAYELGFNESNYFSKVFKEENGLTPSEYRLQNTEELMRYINKITE